MESKYTKRLLEVFPNSFGLVDKKFDPTHAILDRGGVFVTELERDETRIVKRLFIDESNPVEPSGIYYIQLPDNDIQELTIEIQPSGDVKVVDSEVDFLDQNITGFDFIEDIYPSGIPATGIIGLTYGFNWEDSAYYVTIQNSGNVYKLSDLFVFEKSIDFILQTQNYENMAADEYINFKFEVAGSGLVPSGVFPDDIVKVAYLNHESVGDVTLIDTINLQNPNNENSDGIIVNNRDYTVQNGGRIVFSKIRSDYNPATLMTYMDGSQEYIYPSNYQPDLAFDSVFIAEYSYLINGNPRYLTQGQKLHNLCVDVTPESTYDDLGV